MTYADIGIKNIGLNRYAVFAPHHPSPHAGFLVLLGSSRPLAPSALWCENMELLLAADSISQKEPIMTTLRQRMTEDMQVRNLSPHTQTSYVQQVSLFARRRSACEIGRAHV